ncbi:MAG: hypothetical protein ACLR1Q_07700 [Ruminococcus sp.]
MESSFSSGFFLLKKEKQAKEKEFAVRQGKRGIIFFIWFLFAEKRKVGKRKKRLPFSRESMKSSFSSGFFLLKKKAGKRKKNLPFGRESVEFSFSFGFFLLKKEK